jgi:hypothetical protein
MPPDPPHARSGARPPCCKCRGFAGVSACAAKSLESRECLADDTVASEPVCGVNSLLTGQRTGNFFEEQDFLQNAPHKNGAISVAWDRIPYETEQGISLTQPGIYIDEQ